MDIESFGQGPVSGEYESGLKLAYDNNKKVLSGYFESYTGWDERTKKPRFSCIFYIQGKSTGRKSIISTYYPLDSSGDLIVGTIEVIDGETVRIRLPENHGGCWNVQNFTDDSIDIAKFSIKNKANWFQVRYVQTDKTFFYKDRLPRHKMKSYLLKGNFVCIDTINGKWAHCTYYGQKLTTSGWLRLDDLSDI